MALTSVVSFLPLLCLFEETSPHPPTEAGGSFEMQGTLPCSCTGNAPWLPIPMGKHTCQAAASAAPSDESLSPPRSFSSGRCQTHPATGRRKSVLPFLTGSFLSVGFSPTVTSGDLKRLPPAVPLNSTLSNMNTAPYSCGGLVTIRAPNGCSFLRAGLVSLLRLIHCRVSSAWNRV